MFNTIVKNILIFLSFIANFSFAQDGENPLPYVHQEAKFDTAPRFPGGEEAMMKYFADNIIYPQPEKTKGLQGYVSLKFDVTKDGKIINIMATNGVPGAQNLVKEAIRIIKNMPAWIPANKNGIAVDVIEYNLNVPFKIK